MIVKRLRLRNFRNYELLEAEFSDKLNIFYGENAQGKTNVLEAVFLCATGRSHRTLKDTEMIMFGKNSATVTLELERENYGSTTGIEIEIQRSGKKAILVNGIAQQRAGDLLGRLNCVIFSPEDLAIIKDEPQVRRRFLDMFISQIKPAYYYNLHRYLGVLRQRNALLRQVRDNAQLLDTIGAWNIPLAELGAKVIRERGEFIEKIGACAKINHALITGGREELKLIYEPALKYTGAANNGDDLAPGSTEEEAIRRAFINALERGLQTDIARMSTQCGPQRDDIGCTVDGKNIRLYGSQGQQRTAALALKTAQVDVMTAEIGDTPVMLLDDVMSELDRGRQKNISDNMKRAQTFITGTERYAAAGPERETAYFFIENGKFSNDH